MNLQNSELKVMSVELSEIHNLELSIQNYTEGGYAAV